MAVTVSICTSPNAIVSEYPDLIVILCTVSVTNLQIVPNTTSNSSTAELNQCLSSSQKDGENP